LQQHPLIQEIKGFLSSVIESSVAIIQLLKKRYPQPENHHQEKSIYEKFDEIGLIGCCAVEENLSTTYKEVLSNTLPNKYDHS
jgi:RNA polymerase-interacting CarD/CdnL/TRCF family regulator